MWTTPLQIAISYTVCTDLYVSLTAYAIQLLQAAYTYLHAVYTNYDCPSRLVNWVYDAMNPHGRSPLHVDHSAANGILVHAMRGTVRLRDRVRHAAATGCLHILGGPVVPRRLGVPIRDCVWHFTTPRGPLHSKQHFRTSFVRICTSP